MEKAIIFCNKLGVFKRLSNGVTIPYKDDQTRITRKTSRTTT